MTVKTAKGIEFECESITSNPSPLRLYLHLVNVSAEGVADVFGDKSQLPLESFPIFTEVQSISPEGTARVKVALKHGGN